ncbi:15374_t:CDS:2, partial [Entrophospora sp. SA101]
NVNKIKNIDDEKRNLMKSFPFLMEAEVEEAFSNGLWILASINKHYSKMPYELWNINRNNTNVVEASHANINRDGTRMSLLAAINISSKNKSQTQKYVESAKRKASEDLSQQEQYISLLEKRIQLEEKLYEAVLKRKQ